MTTDEMRGRPSHLIEILGEGRCVVINILHHYGDVGLGLVPAVCGSDRQGVPGLLLKVQRGGEGHAATVAVDPKLP